jgi:integrating conjugative element protein (TIGR03759 family)
MKSIFCFVGLVVAIISNQVAAQALSTTKAAESELTSTKETKSTHTITPEEISLAKLWMLTESDWIKYKKVMQGPRGIWSPGLDPITALGVAETDSVQRKRYAEIWIKVESRRAELELAFEFERSGAAKRLLADKQVVNNTSWVNEWTQKRDSVQKIVHIFMDVACLEKCKTFYDQVHSSIGNNSRLDIFFKEGASSDQIGKWAAFMNIAPELVKARKITLNFDEGKSAKLSVSPTNFPVVKVLDVKSGKVISLEK